MTQQNHPSPADAAATAPKADPAPPAAAPPPVNWRRLWTFLLVLTVGMTLAWIACDLFPASPPGPRKTKADVRDSSLKELGLLRDQMPPLRQWQYIVLHHTATAGASVASIDEQHRGNGWDGIGYHFVIGNGSAMQDGLIEPTYRWWGQKTGAHALADGTIVTTVAHQQTDVYNTHGLGIVMVGSFNNAAPTAAQVESLVRLTAGLADRFDVPMSNIIAHRELKTTDCPGRQFPMADVLRQIADLRMSRRTGK